MKQNITDITNKILEQKFVPVIRTYDYHEAKKYAQILIKSGLKIIELTFTIPKVNQLVQELKASWPHIYVGVGTILNVKQAQINIDAGADFLVAPTFSDDVAQLAQKLDILYVPGFMTISEAERIINAKINILKCFPFSVYEPSYIKAIKSIFPQVKIMVTGGITAKNVAYLLKNTEIDAVGMGSSLTAGTEEQIQDRVMSIIKEVHEWK